MNKPDSNLEAQFNKDGIFFLDQGDIQNPIYEGSYIGVAIEIAVLIENPIEPPTFAVSVLNKRDVSILFTNWEFIERDGQKLLKFSAYQRMPEVFPGILNASRYMSFLDLCFFAGNEAIPEVYGEDIVTKPREGAVASDLGWILPSRFVDALIPALGKLDDSMLSGMINQTLLYGPNFINKS